jgi:hypothetical protein
VFDRSQFSRRLLAHPEAATETALARIAVAKRRVQSVLDQYIVAHRRTLEQKISEQGPKPQRADPHLLGLAIMDLMELNRLRARKHPSTGTQEWYANPATTDGEANERLSVLAPLYSSVSGHGFGNLTGDALELIVYKILDRIYSANPRYAYQGQFLLDQPKENGRYRKIPPPKHLGSHQTQKEADFFQFGHDAGPLCLECKNLREWIYPNSRDIKELIVKAADLHSIPLLVARRIHYSTRTNLLEPAGIIAHETFLNYYPLDQSELANRVRAKDSLGFTDVTATEEPHPRSILFFETNLPKILARMNERWQRNLPALVEYAKGTSNLAQLYTVIGSPAGGKWFNANDPTEFPF